MKRTVDWSLRNEGELDTQGLGKPWMTIYFILLAIVTRKPWHDEIRSGEFIEDSFLKLAATMAQWVFGDLADQERDELRSHAKETYKILSTANFDDFSLDDTIHEKFPSRKFRSSPRLNAILVHIGHARFEDYEREFNAEGEIIFPKNLGIKRDRNWVSIKGLKLDDLVSFLQRASSADTLTIKVGGSESTFCLTETPLTAPPPTPPNPAGRGNGVRGPNWGLGQYLLFYGPPGTGKTREANRFIQKQLAKQIETSSGGEIRQPELNGIWADDRRSLILSELRKFVSVTQFHATYSYEDFIEGLKPLNNNDGEIRYEIVDGSFMSLWRKATGTPARIRSVPSLRDQALYLEIDPYFVKLYDLDIEAGIELRIPDLNIEIRGVLQNDSNVIAIEPTESEKQKILALNSLAITVRGESWSSDCHYYLLVDEINRGKVSKIFGELLFAMAASAEDKLPEVRTQYSKTPLQLPQNLHVVATMNTCDKSVDVLDQALKRRFEMRELMPLSRDDLASNSNWRSAVESFQERCGISLADLLDCLNKRLLESQLVDYDRQIGHSFMFKACTLANKNIQDGASGRVNEDLALRALFKVYFSDIYPVLQDFFLDRRGNLETLVPNGFLSTNSHALIPKVRRLLSSTDNLAFDAEIWRELKTEFVGFLTSLAQNGRRSAA